MKVAIQVDHQKIEIIEADEPDINKLPDGAVKIKTELSAICGSDTPKWLLEQADYPGRLGLSIHEAIGTVSASNSDRFSPGDRVLALPREVGGCSEYFTSHETVTMPLVDYERDDCILMAQPLGTVIWAIRKLGSVIDKDVAVMGQGPIGLLTVHSLSNLGAKRVIGIDPVEFRLETGRKMRATHSINPDREDVIEKVSEITNGEMLDVAVEMVGHNFETVGTCLELVKRRGTVLCFGIPDENIYPFNYRAIISKNISLIGSVGPEAQRDFPLAMDWISQGRIDVAPMITHRIPFTDVQKGFEMFVNERDKAIKVVMEY